MTIYFLPGAQVKLRSGQGSESKRAKELLDPEKIYTVDWTEINTGSTDIYLKEFPGVRFNSSCLKDIEGDF